MNKILFRGFHPDNNGATTITLNGEKIKGKWVYGLLPFRNEIRVFTTHKWNDEGEEREYATTEDLGVLPETVGQWVTNDKNGKDVFGGDIVQDIDGRIYEIKYFDFEWIAEQAKSFWINVKHLKECEIFSNIWEVEDERV